MTNSIDFTFNIMGHSNLHLAPGCLTSTKRVAGVACDVYEHKVFDMLKGSLFPDMS